MVAPNAVSREQAYLTSVANQPKDIDPDRIYEVSGRLQSGEWLQASDCGSHKDSKV
jgi:hypothetical protein